MPAIRWEGRLRLVVPSIAAPAHHTNQQEAIVIRSQPRTNDMLVRERAWAITVDAQRCRGCRLAGQGSDSCNAAYGRDALRIHTERLNSKPVE